MSQPMAEALINAGVGAFIAVMVLVGIYRLVNRYFRDFINVQRGQVEAVTRQARSMEALTGAIERSTRRDNSEHREMLVLLRFLAQQQQHFDEVRREHNERKEQAHPNCPFGTSEDRVPGGA
jgi:hypothetical protein